MTTLAQTARAATRRAGFTSPLRMLALVRQRRQLAALDPHLLADIGVTRAEAEAEAARPAWDVPAHWMRLR